MKPMVLWMTGLSGAGKTTLANDVKERLESKVCDVKVLDGDEMRSGLCSDLGFTDDDRTENIRRAAHVAKMFMDYGNLVITAFISPFAKNRQCAREIIGAENFHEVWVKCNFAECECRDPKGLYRAWREGKIENFTGDSSPYVEPNNPQLIVDTSEQTVKESVNEIMNYIERVSE